jgi:hypothetical protein
MENVIDLSAARATASIKHVLRVGPPVAGERCDKCFYFFHEPDGQFGSCHESRPQVVAIPQLNSMRQPVISINSIWPPVSLDGWCDAFADLETELSMDNLAKDE